MLSTAITLRHHRERNTFAIANPDPCATDHDPEPRHRRQLHAEDIEHVAEQPGGEPAQGSPDESPRARGEHPSRRRTHEKVQRDDGDRDVDGDQERLLIDPQGHEPVQGGSFRCAGRADAQLSIAQLTQSCSEGRTQGTPSIPRVPRKNPSFHGESSDRRERRLRGGWVRSTRPQRARPRRSPRGRGMATEAQARAARPRECCPSSDWAPIQP